MKNFKTKAISAILLFCLILQPVLSMGNSFLAPPGASSIPELADWVAQYDQPLNKFYVERNRKRTYGRENVIRKMIKRLGIVKNYKTAFNRHIAAFLSFVYFPPVMDLETLEDFLEEFVRLKLEARDLPGFIKMKIKHYFEANAETVLNKTKYKDKLKKEIEIYLDVVSGLNITSNKYKTITQLIAFNNIGLSLETYRRHEIAWSVVSVYLQVVVDRKMLSSIFNKFKASKLHNGRLAGFVVDETFEYLRSHKQDVLKKMQGSMLYREIILAYFSNIARRKAKYHISEMISLLEYFKNGSDEKGFQDALSFRIKTMKKKRFDVYYAVAKHVRSYIKRNKSEFLKKDLNFYDSCLGHSYEIKERLERIGIASEIYGVLDIEKGYYHTWVVTGDGFIIDAYTLDDQIMKIVEVSSLEAKYYKGVHISQMPMAKLLEDMERWNEVNRDVFNKERDLLGDFPDKTLVRYMVIKNHPELKNVADAARYFLGRKVPGIGDVIYNAVDERGNLNEEFLGELIEAYAVEKNVKYARIVRLSKRKVGDKGLNIPELDYVLEVDQVKYAGKTTGTVELEKGFYLGESKTFFQHEGLTSNVTKTIKDKYGKYKWAADEIRRFEDRNVKGIILTIGGASVRAAGITEFRFDSMPDLGDDFYIAYVPDKILHEYVEYSPRPKQKSFEEVKVEKRDLSPASYFESMVAEIKNMNDDQKAATRQILLDLLAQHKTAAHPKIEVMKLFNAAVQKENVSLMAQSNITSQQWAKIFANLKPPVIAKPTNMLHRLFTWKTIINLFSSH